MSKVRLTGSTSGYTEIQASAVAGDNTLSLPTTTDGTLVATDTSGRLLVGTDSARANYGGGSESAALQLEGTGANRRLSVTGADNAAAVILARQRSGSVGGNTIVQFNDILGILRFEGSDGANFITGADIRATVDGTPGTNDMPSALVFSTTADGASSPTERMKINRGGEHFFRGTGNVQYVLSDQSAGTSTSLFWGGYSATAIDSATNSYKVFTNGNVVNTNNSYGALSDIKLKENIVDASSQWDDLKDLRVVNYNFKEGQTHTQIGLIAQEVELVSPGLVYETPDRDAEGNDLGTVTKSVNYSVLYMKAVKALQEAMERIETLEAANTDLAARITALEAN